MPVPSTSSPSLVSTVSPPAPPAPPRQNLLLLGVRRSGKSSILNVVYRNLPPNDTLFLDSTLRAYTLDIDVWEPLRVWDGPGGSSSTAAKADVAVEAVVGAATEELHWTQIGAVVFVIDAQVSHYVVVGGDSRLMQTLECAYRTTTLRL